jgi:hypothetical protein
MAVDIYPYNNLSGIDFALFLGRLGWLNGDTLWKWDNSTECFSPQFSFGTSIDLWEFMCISCYVQCCTEEA